jgi:ATP-binding cassette subfamily G (WHITE) protein 2 (SNQ2)
MLDVIGAGAATTSERDWHRVWLESAEAKMLQEDIEDIHSEGRSRPPMESTRRSEFATSWAYQTKALVVRGLQNYWRTPQYLKAKLMLNILGGLFMGFTFFKAKDTMQGTQNKLFAVFMSMIIAAPLGNQLHVPYKMFREIYDIRERSTWMYSTSALTAAQLLAELPWNILGSSLFFLTWYWTVGFDSSRAGYVRISELLYPRAYFYLFIYIYADISHDWHHLPPELHHTIAHGCLCCS